MNFGRNATIVILRPFFEDTMTEVEKVSLTFASCNPFLSHYPSMATDNCEWHQCMRIISITVITSKLT